MKPPHSSPDTRELYCTRPHQTGCFFLATHSPNCLGHQRGTLYKGPADCDTYYHNQVPQTRVLDTLPDSLNVRCALGGGRHHQTDCLGCPPLPPTRTPSGGMQVVAQLILRGGKRYRSTSTSTSAPECRVVPQPKVPSDRLFRPPKPSRLSLTFVALGEWDRQRWGGCFFDPPDTREASRLADEVGFRVCEIINALDRLLVPFRPTWYVFTTVARFYYFFVHPAFVFPPLGERVTLFFWA